MKREKKWNREERGVMGQKEKSEESGK